MTDLQEGRQYSLCNKNKNNKSVIFVKLTDSALKSIETFLNAKDSSSKPTIQFQNNNKGVISLPLNGTPHNYGFTLSNIEGDKVQSGFQCLQHIDDSSLDSLGFMLMKMQIHATEDSYEATKSKMAAADQEQKNFCTKQLRQTVTKIGSKVSVKRPGLLYVPEKTQPSTLKCEPTKFNLKNKAISPASLIHQPIRLRIIHILAAKAYKKAELILRLKREGISDKDKEQINDILIEVAKLKGNVFTLENHIWNEVQEDWEFSSKEEQQLIKKKKQQFLKPNNVNGVGVTGLCKPAVKQKVKPSIIEKTLANKKLFQHINEPSCNSVKKPNLSNNGTSQVSKKQSASTKNIGPLLSSFVQQQLKNKETNGQEEKMCVDVASNGNIGQCELSSPNPITPNATSRFQKPECSNVPKIQVKQSNNCSGSSNSRTNFISRQATLEKIKLIKQKLKDHPPNSHNQTVEEGNKINGSCSRADLLVQPFPEFNFPEIHKKYTKIESWEQRLQYIDEYNNHLDEYQKLQTEMTKISERFSAMYDQLKAYTEGSPEYERIKIEMGKEYKKIIQDSYLVSRERFEFLQAKLRRLRELILEYDKNM